MIKTNIWSTIAPAQFLNLATTTRALLRAEQRPSSVTFTALLAQHGRHTGDACISVLNKVASFGVNGSGIRYSLWQYELSLGPPGIQENRNLWSREHILGHPTPVQLSPGHS